MIRDVIQPVIRDVVRGIYGELNVLDYAPLAWYDAFDAVNQGVITLNGSDVATWDDKSGNGKHIAQATAADQPAFANNTVSFDGVTEYLFRAESFMYSATNTVTLFVVMESSAAAGSRMITETSSITGAPLYLLLENSTSDTSIIKTTIRNDASVLISGGVSAVNAFQSGVTKIYSIEDDLSNITTTINGASEVVTPYTRPAVPITLNRFGLGGRVIATPDTFADIDVNEIIIFDHALDSSEKAAINAHLASKWGI